jgi:Fur family ferric uptake transcriptional regulator
MNQKTTQKKDKTSEIKERARRMLAAYLTLKQKRNTSERMAILDLVYSTAEHFDIEWLYIEMEKQGIRVSRSTLYNTMQLLVECKLALKHQFGNGLTVYERSYETDLHHHLICTECQKIMEYKDPGLIQFLNEHGLKRFTPTHYNLNIYGICTVCARKKREAEKKAVEERKKLEIACGIAGGDFRRKRKKT